MDIHFENADIAWVKSIDFNNPTFCVRDDKLRCKVVSLPELDCSVFVLLAPMQHGLWMLRIYLRLYRSLYTFFDGDDRARTFEAFLRKHRIPKTSQIAAKCFGPYPGAWFLPRPRHSSILTWNRLLSVAVPATRADRLRDYFQQQALQFGDRCITAADEDEILFITEREHGTEDSGLLLDLVSRMDDARRAAVRDRLIRLLQSEDQRREFARKLSPGMKISGAFRAPDLRDIRSDCEEDCIEIARLRVKLMCALEWPHSLECIRSTMVDTPQGHFADLVPEIDAVLAKFPVIASDPLN